tara:strand:- start:504 stop:638 length:135 start_codon:yes stop_codon:yes gene_type:complete
MTSNNPTKIKVQEWIVQFDGTIKHLEKNIELIKNGRSPNRLNDD